MSSPPPPTLARSGSSTKAISLSSLPPDMRSELAALDLDGDGTINVGEIIAAAHKHFQSAPHVPAGVVSSSSIPLSIFVFIGGPHAPL